MICTWQVRYSHKGKITMFEVIHNYRKNCLLQGPQRVKLLQKVVAAAAAYSSPCPVGSMSDVNGFYMELCRHNAIRIVSAVNEHILVNTDEVMADVELLWKGRFELINSPQGCTAFTKFHESMSTYGEEVASHYEYWVEHFLASSNSYLIRVNGGE